MKDQAEELRKMMSLKDKRYQKVISIASGKGGVGKTNIAINLAIALNELGQKVLVVDADLGLGNVNVILGNTPDFNMYHVIKGIKKLNEIIVETPYGIRYIAGASGFSQLANLSRRSLSRLVKGIDALNDVDIIIVDTGAGISDTVISFILASDEAIIVTTPEPTAMIDAYGVIKSVVADNSEMNINILVNRINNMKEGRKVSDRIVKISKQFLNVDIKTIGYVYEDKIIPYCVTRQLPFYVYDNKSKSSLCLDYVANRILNPNEEELKKSRGIAGFFESLLKMARDTKSDK